MTNKVGIHYAYWTHDWNVDFVPLISRAAALGFEAFEVNAGTIARLGKQERRRLKDAGIAAGLSLSCCVGLPSSSDIASSSASTRAQGIAHLGRIADAMVDCGIDRLSGIIYSCWPGAMEGREETRDEARGWSIASMREAIKKAEDQGLLYAVEVVNRFEQFLLNTADEAVSYVQQVGSPNLRILLDTYHMNIEEDTFAGAIRTAGGHLGHFHIGENNRKPPGRGHIPWSEIGSSLKSVGYQGWVVMEPFLMKGGEVGRDIRVNRDVMPGADLDAEARAACVFTKRLLA
jgi:D-psicose/D-tagatose/L-ribulose 3-epimerase